MSTRRDPRLLLAILALFVPGTPLHSQHRVVIDHAGTVSGVVTDGPYRVRASIGSATAAASGGGYRVQGGFLNAATGLNDRLFADGSEG